MSKASGERKFQVCESEFRRHRNDYDGLCMACGHWTSGGVEPDARNYACEGCEKKKVQGAETAIISGRLEVVQDDVEIPEEMQTVH